MVSKCKILGKSPVVLVTVGTSPFSFDRLFTAIDKALNQDITKRQLIIQQGNSHYRWKYKYKKKFAYLSPKKLQRIIKDSKWIITHGGFGTIFEIAKYASCMPLIIPRLSFFREHINNHQLSFVEYLSAKFPILLKKYFLTQTNIDNNLQWYLQSNHQKNYLKEQLFKKNYQRTIITNLKAFINKAEKLTN